MNWSQNRHNLWLESERQDISASWFGGYLFDAKACGLGGGQDERLSVYFPEVTILAYFLSQSDKYPQLRQPAWFLGARNFFKNLDGTARFDSPMVLAEVPLKSDLVDVSVADHLFEISSSRPVVVFMSESQGLVDDYSTRELQLARLNRLQAQREMGTGQFAFEKQAHPAVSCSGRCRLFRGYSACILQPR